MEITLRILLPHDELSVPVVRRVLATGMSALGVERGVVDDIVLALTEAVTNVLDHAQDGDVYEVSASLRDNTAVVEVIDRGAGLPDDACNAPCAEPEAESGRGIAIMRALVDRVSFTSRPREGTVVHLEKELVWTPDSPLRRLSGSAH